MSYSFTAVSHDQKLFPNPAMHSKYILLTLSSLFYTINPLWGSEGKKGGGWGEGEGKRNKQSDPWTMNIGLVRGMHSPEIGTIDNGNRTKWSLIRSVIIWVINKIGRLQSRGLICLSLLWLQTELDNKKSCYQLIITISCLLLKIPPFWKLPCFFLDKWLFLWLLWSILWLVELADWT